MIRKFMIDRPYISGHEMKLIGMIEKEDLVDIVCDICGKSTKNETNK